MTHIVASGGEGDIVNLVGNHECSKTTLNFSLRAAGTKASLVKVLRDDTRVRAVPYLPQQNLKTAVVVHAICAVRRCSFHKDETSGAVAWRYMNQLPTDTPTDTDSMYISAATGTIF